MIPALYKLVLIGTLYRYTIEGDFNIAMETVFKTKQLTYVGSAIEFLKKYEDMYKLRNYISDIDIVTMKALMTYGNGVQDMSYMIPHINANIEDVFIINRGERENFIVIENWKDHIILANTLCDSSTVIFPNHLVYYNSNPNEPAWIINRFNEAVNNIKEGS